MISSYQLPAPRGSQTFRDLHRFFTVLRCLGIFGGVLLFTVEGSDGGGQEIHQGSPHPNATSEGIRRHSSVEFPLCFLGLAWPSSIWVANPSPSWIFIKWQLVWFMGKRCWFWTCYVVLIFFWVKPSGELVHHYLSFVEGVKKCWLHIRPGWLSIMSWIRLNADGLSDLSCAQDTQGWQTNKVASHERNQ